MEQELRTINIDNFVMWKNVVEEVTRQVDLAIGKDYLSMVTVDKGHVIVHIFNKLGVIQESFSITTASSVVHKCMGEFTKRKAYNRTVPCVSGLDADMPKHNIGSESIEVKVTDPPAHDTADINT